MGTDKSPELVSASVSDRGLSDKRPQNEDSFLEIPQHAIYAVADGVGGAQAGDVASQMAVEILGEAFQNQKGDADAEDVMRVAIERANAAIFQMAEDLPQLSSMATTIAALQLKGDVATIGHVGDSRVYRIDPRGKLHRETNDHSVVEEEVRAGRMTAEQALNHPSRNVISRALGAERTVEVELKTLMIEPGTRFLLCSDGVTRHIPDPELEALFAEFDQPAQAAAQIKEVCFSRGAEDNLTAVVVRSGTTDAEHASLQEPPIELSPQPADIEEDTIATPRITEAAAGDVVMDEHTSELDAGDGGDIDGSDEREDRSIQTVETQGVASTSAEKVSAAPVFSAYDPGEESIAPRPGMFSRIVTGLFLLILGGLIGAAAYRYLVPAPPRPEPVPTLVEKSPDVPLTAFEEGRRLVDKDPAAFLAANAASPQDAEDYFLTGRALLLTGKYWEAKRAFTEARDRLAEADPKNARTMAAEISMALAVIASPGASEAFSRDIAAGGANANASVATPASNTNTAPSR